MKKLWSGIKTIVSHKNSSSSTINKIKDRDTVLTSDSTKISNVFNDYFVNVADQITKSIPRNPKSPLDYLRNRNSNSIFLTPVIKSDIEAQVSSVSPVRISFSAFGCDVSAKRNQ